jgi:hypothetical protein
MFTYLCILAHSLLFLQLLHPDRTSNLSVNGGRIDAASTEASQPLRFDPEWPHWKLPARAAMVYI